MFSFEEFSVFLISGRDFYINFREEVEYVGGSGVGVSGFKRFRSNIDLFFLFRIISGF